MRSESQLQQLMLRIIYDGYWPVDVKIAFQGTVSLSVMNATVKIAVALDHKAAS